MSFTTTPSPCLKKKTNPKTPNGMIDYLPEDMVIREQIFGTIREIFKKHGGVEIETPVCELKEILTGKYGEDTKLIYDIADQGGETLALRYDLTVPFTRFCAKYGISKIRRFHIARVYRRDTPQIERGRYREFYQCDWDVAGEYESMVPDAECVKITNEIMTSIGLDNHLIKINHRKILDGIFEICGVEKSFFRPICSVIDKLDKSPWSEVKEEMLRKGIGETTAERIWEFVQQKGGLELVEKLLQDERVQGNLSMKSGLEEIVLLFNYIKDFDVPEKYVVFDLSLARGLDYYTGVIYECILLEEFVGSVAGGGRYDNLIGMFYKNEKKVPCVGISIGIERLFTVIQQKNKAVVKTLPTDVFIASGEKEMFRERLRICGELWNAKIRANTFHILNPKLLSQFQYCEKECIPLIVIIGSNEIQHGTVKIRNVATREEKEVQRTDLVNELRILKEKIE